MSLAADKNNDDFNKPSKTLIFDSLEDMADDFMATDPNIVNTFKSRKHNKVRNTLFNLKQLENIRIYKPLKFVVDSEFQCKNSDSFKKSSNEN